MTIQITADVEPLAKRQPEQQTSVRRKRQIAQQRVGGGAEQPYPLLPRERRQWSPGAPKRVRRDHDAASNTGQPAPPDECFTIMNRSDRPARSGMPQLPNVLAWMQRAQAGTVDAVSISAAAFG